MTGELTPELVAGIVGHLAAADPPPDPRHPGHCRRLTPDDRAVLADPTVDDVAAAEQLGRTIYAVYQLRLRSRRLGDEPQVCKRCQQSKPPAAFRGRSLVCRRCRNVAVKARTAHRRATDADLRRRHNERSQRRHVRLELTTRAFATRKHQRYTTTELAILLDPSVSHARAAALLNRSRGAVVQRRYDLRRRLDLADPIRAHASPPAKHVTPAAA